MLPSVFRWWQSFLSVFLLSVWHQKSEICLTANQKCRKDIGLVQLQLDTVSRWKCIAVWLQGSSKQLLSGPYKYEQCNYQSKCIGFCPNMRSCSTQCTTIFHRIRNNIFSSQIALPCCMHNRFLVWFLGSLVFNVLQDWKYA